MDTFLICLLAAIFLICSLVAIGISYIIPFLLFRYLGSSPNNKKDDPCPTGPQDLVFVANLIKRHGAHWLYQQSTECIHFYYIDVPNTEIVIIWCFNQATRCYHMSVWHNDLMQFLFSDCSAEAIAHVLHVMGFASHLYGRIVQVKPQKHELEEMRSQLVQRYTAPENTA